MSRWWKAQIKVKGAAKKMAALFLLLGTFVLAPKLGVWAATLAETYTSAGNYVLSDSLKIGIVSGKLQLLTQHPFYLHDTKTEFDTGTYGSDTEFSPSTDTGSSPIRTSDSGLVAYFPLNDGGSSQTVTESKSANNAQRGNTSGSASDDPAWVTGKYGSALSFDGGDFVKGVDVTNGTAYDFNAGASFTVTFWINNTGGGIGVINKGGNYDIRAYSGGVVTFGSSAGSEITSTGTLTNGKWNHVAVVKSGTTITWYIDGVNAGSGTRDNGGPNTSALEFGRDSGSGSNITALLDDVAFYNRALTAAEVQSQAASGAAIHMKATASITKHAPKLTGKEPGLVGYWPMDYSSGTTAPDMAGSYKLTLNNSPTFVSGVNGNALSMTATDRGGNPSPTIKGFAKFSISAWVKTSTTGTQRGIVSHGWFDNPSDFWLRINSTNKASIGGRFAAGYFEEVVSTTSVTDGNWHHVVGVVDGTNVKMYIDGTQEGSQALGAHQVYTQNFQIGAPNGSSENFNGQIDEVSYWNRALSANEIAYLAGKKGETATYTSPVMDGEIAAVKWDKLTTSTAKVTPGMNFTPISYSGGDTPTSGLFVDLNLDGALDFIRGAAGGGPGTVTGYRLNNGDGTFGALTTFTERNVSVVAADLDRDGDQDIICGARDTTGGQVVYFKNNNGTLAAETVVQTAFVFPYVAVGDIDGDGYPDIAALEGNLASSRLAYWKNDGAGNFGSLQSVDTGLGTDGNGLQSLLLVDMDQDGDLDILGSRWRASSGAVFCYINNGTGTFGTVQTLASSSVIAVVSAGDLNGDGMKDIVYGNQSFGQAFMKLQTQASPLTFGSATAVSDSGSSRANTDIVDLNNDGHMDIVFSAACCADGVYWRQNTGDGVPTFAAQQALTSTSDGTGQNYGRMAIGDLDGDGDLDFYTTYGGTFFFNNPWKVNALSTATYYAYGTQIASADINNSGRQSILVASPGNTIAGGSRVYLWLNNGSDSFGSRTDLGSYTDATGLATMDVDADGWVDIVLSYTGNLKWLKNNQNNTFTAQAPAIETTNVPNSIVVADFDADGLVDIAGAETSNTAATDLYWWKNTGGAFGSGNSISSGSVFQKLVSGDMDGDGDVDLVTCANPSGTADNLYLYSNNGSGTFTRTTIASSIKIEDMVRTDFDNDGKLDLVVVDVTNDAISWYKNNGGGSFAARQTLVSSAGANYITAADVDGDGWNDIVVTTTTTAQWYKNLGGSSVGKALLMKSGLTLGYSVITGPFSGNGLVDIAFVDMDSTAGGVYELSQQPHAQIKLQLQTDSDATPNGSFVGPDGTATTFYGSTAGIRESLASPSPGNRYGQYKVTFYRNDTTLDPIVKNIRLDYTALPYTTTNPYADQAASTAFSYLTSFAETATKPAGSEIKYQISADGGSNWRYYSTGAWQLASLAQYSEASTASVNNTNIATLDNAFSMTANGNLKVRAFLNSDGNALPQLDQLDLGYEVASVSLVQPDTSGIVWKAGTTQDITWTPTGTVPNDLTLEYTTTGGAPYTSIATNIKNNHNEEILSGAVGVWHFDGATSGAIANNATSGLTDSKNTNNGTASNVNGTGMAWTTGKFGGAVTFDGVDDKINVADNAALNVTTNLSFVCWFKRNSTNSFQQIYDGRNGSSSFLIWMPGSGAAPISFRSEGGEHLFSVNMPTDSNWHHLAIVKNGDTGNNVSFYLDGTFQEAIGVGAISSGSGAGKIIGNSFDGSLDDVALFNRVLTAAEIAVLASNNCRYPWAIPSNFTVANNLKVHVVSATAPAINDLSANNFAIAKLDITSPNGTEVWKAGFGRQITWTQSGAVPNDLTIEYSRDGGSTWVSPALATGITATDGAYSWTLPTGSLDINATTRVRIRSVGASTNSLDDSSDANFTIADMNLIYPNGGEFFKTGTAQDIRWTQSVGTPSDVTLKYAKDGTTYSDISSSISPNLSSSKIAKLAFRLDQTTGATTALDTASGFAAVVNGSPTFVAGKYGNAISLNGTSDYVVHGGLTGMPSLGGPFTLSLWYKVASNPSDQRIMAQVYAVPSSVAGLAFGFDGGNIKLIRVSDNAVFFSVAPPAAGSWHNVVLTVSNSSYGTLYIDGTQVSAGAIGAGTGMNMQGIFIGARNGSPAASYFNGQIDDVMLYNRTLTDPEIAALATSSLSAFTNATAYTPVSGDVTVGAAGKMRLISAADSNFWDDSNAAFTVGSFDITSPNGSEVWKIGKVYPITWTASAGNVPSDMTLKYATDGTNFSTTIGITGSIKNNHNEKLISGSVAVWHLDENTGTSTADDTANNFTGTASVSTVWGTGKFGSGLTLDGSKSVNFSTAGTGIRNLTQMTYSAWIKPTTINSFGFHTILGTFVTGNCATDSVSFYIEGGSSAGSGTVKLKQGSTVLAVSGTISTGSLTHVAAVFDSVAGVHKIYINGTPSSQTTAATAVSASTNGSIKVGVNGCSSSGFVGDIDEVAIFNRALSASEISALAAANPNYQWTVPSITASNTMKIQIASTSAPAFTDNSDANFTIADINLTSPNGAEVWKAGSVKNITWSATNFVPDDLRLEYSRDGGTTWVGSAIATGQNHTSGTPYSWTLPSAYADLGTAVRVRVRSISATELDDTSNADFSIADVNVAVPNGGENWKQGTPQAILWGYDGASLSDFTLKYAADGTTFNKTIASSVSSNGTAVSAQKDATTISGLVGLWHFDEASGNATNSSSVGSALNGTMNGTVSRGAGKFGNAANFDGNNANYFNVANNANLNFTTGLTISFWAKPTNSAGYVLRKSGNWAANFFYNTGYYVDSTISGVSGNGYTSNTGDDGQWHYYAVTYDPGSQKYLYYYDGALLSTTNTTGSMTTSTNNLVIGRDSGAGAAYSGLLDELAIFNRALKQSEIMQLASRGYSFTPDGTYTTTTGAVGKIQISSASKTELIDASDAGFTLGKFDISSPNGGEIWKIGKVYPITWQATNGSIPNDLTLKYATDGSTFSTTIASNVKNNHNEELMSGAVGVWHLDSSAANSVSGGSALNGTLNGTASYASAKYGNGLSLDGNGYVTVPENTALNVTKVTLAAWVKPNTLGDSGMIMDRYNAYRFSFGYSGGYYLHSTVWNASTSQALISSVFANDTNWHHIAMTYDGANIIQYADGVQVGIQPFTGNITTGYAAGLCISCDTGNYNAGHFGGGKIDEAVLFNRALTAAEIAALASNNPSYPWTVPSISASNQMKIQMSSPSVPNFTDASDANFTIANINITAPTINTDYPTTAVTLKAASSEQITWTATNFVPDNLTLEYSRDGGTTWQTPLATNLNHTSGTPYSWTVPSATADINTTTKVRVRSTTATELDDTSDVNFTIADLNVASPNGGEFWKVGVAQAIQWSPAGTVPDDLTLEYAANGSTFNNTIATGVAAAGNAVSVEKDPAAFSGKAGIWRMNESSGNISDTSGNNNTGTVSNGSFVAGKWGNALNFNGTSTFVNLGNAASLNPTSAISLAAWVNFGGTVSAGETVIQKSQQNGNQLQYTLGTYVFGSGQAQVQLGNVSMNDRVVGNTVLQPNTWYHLAATYDGAMIRLYVNGKEDAAPTPSTVTLTAFGNAAVLGREATTGGFYLSGMLDDVAVYNRALTQGEVMQLASRGFSYTPVTGDISSAGKVRVRSVGASTNKLTDVSDAAFRIYDLVVTAPNTAVNWNAGSVRNITWTHNNLPGSTVKILLSTDGGATYPDTIAMGRNKADGTFAWTVPGDKFTTQARIKIVDETQAAVFDESNTNFTINGHTLNVTKPAAAEALGINTVKKINWNIQAGSDSVPAGAKVTLEYSSDGEANTITNADGSVVDNPAKLWNLIDSGIDYNNTESGGCDAGATGCYNWAVPSAAASNTVVVRVKDLPTWNGLGGQNAKDGFSPEFRVVGTTAIIKPNGGEKWASGSAHTISFQTQGTMPTVKISYATSADNYATWNVITPSVANTGSFSWTPSRSQAHANIKIRLEKSDDAQVFDDSDASFSVTGITVTAPDTAARIKAGDPYTITWTSDAVTNVKIEYSTDGSTYPNTVMSSMAAAGGSHAWTVPMYTTPNFKVRITDADAVPSANGPDTALTSDDSDADTTIYGQLIVNAPNGSEDWSSSNPHDITWTVSPSGANVVRNVKIYYTRSGFGSETIEIDPAVNKPSAAGGSLYSWSPDFTSNTVKVRVVDADDPAVASGAAAPSVGQNQDDTNNFFQITGLSATAPVALANYVVGTTRPITFGFTGTVTNVKIEYSNNGGAAWQTVRANEAVGSNPYTYNWVVPDDITTNAKVKLTQCNSDGSIPASPKTATSPTFTITGALAITTPGTLKVGEATTVSWTKTGTIGTVKVEFSPSGNFSGDEISVATGVTGLSTSWTVPDAIGITGKVRVTDTVSNHPVTLSTSSAFVIKGDFVLAAPLGTTEWGVSEDRAITWTNAGSMSTMKVEYATDNDNYGSWTQIYSGANSATTNWTNIPDLVILGGNNPNPPNPIASPTNGKRNVKLRLTDTAHSGAAQAVVESSVFKVKYYLITFSVTNTDGNNLANLNVIDTQTWTVTDDSLTSPSQTKRHYKAASESATWSKSGFTAGVVNFTADADKTVSVLLESETPVPFQVNLFSNYSGASGMLNLSLSLSKAGNSVSGVVLGTSQIIIYDTDGTTVLATLSQPTADANGVFKYTSFTPATYGMTSGNSYSAKCIINYSSVPKTSIGVINFTSEANIQEIKSTLGSVSDAAGASTVFGVLNQQTQTLGTVNSNVAGAKTSADAAKTAVDTLKADIGSISDATGANSLFGKVADVKTSLGVSSTGRSVLQSLENIESAGFKKGKPVARSADASLGSSVEVGFQSDSGLSPTADIYNSAGQKIVSNAKLSEIPGTGIYKYKWDVAAGASEGDYTVVMKEATNGSVESMNVAVRKPVTSSSSGGVDSNQLLRAGDFAEKTYAQSEKIKTDLSTLLEKISDMQALKKKSQTTSSGSTGSTGQTTSITSIQNDLKASEDAAREFAEQLGIKDIDKLLGLVTGQDTEMKDQTEQMKTMKNKIMELLAKTEAMKDAVLDETGSVKIKQWMENGSIILKVLALNPSKTDTQDVPVKTYLPVEAKPEHVMNRDDDQLDIKFDPSQSLYFVEKKVSLKPGESYTLMVHIEDIWQIPAEKTDKIRQRADLAIKALEGSMSFDIAKLLHQNIVANLEVIAQRQSDDSALPHEHIANYRMNVQLLQDIQKDLNSLELFAAKNMGSKDLKNPLASLTNTWKLMIGIVIFLALLSLASFVTWQRQLKNMVKTQDINMVAPDERLQYQKTLMEHSITDALTGLYNAGHFKTMMETELEKAKVEKKEVTLIMIDLDHFKKINDSFGHTAGDEVLKGAAEIIRGKIKKVDFAFRYGGEELAILMYTNVENAKKAAERIRKGLESKTFFLGPQKSAFTVTASFGVASFNFQESLKMLVDRCDAALYRAKKAGRNQIQADETHPK